MNDRLHQVITESIDFDTTNQLASARQTLQLLKERSDAGIGLARVLEQQNYDLCAENAELHWRVWAALFLGVVIGSAIGAAVMAAFTVRR